MSSEPRAQATLSLLLSILAAGPDFRVQLKFLYFHLEASEACRYDFLEIRDGQYGFSPLLFRGCCKYITHITQPILYYCTE